MAIGKINNTISKEDIINIPQTEIARYYLGISSIPCIINSPLRKDVRASLGLYTNDGINIFYKDLSTNDKGSLYKLLSQLWNTSYYNVYSKILNDKNNFNSSNLTSKTLRSISTIKQHNSKTDIEVIKRPWLHHDIEYWESFGINIEALNNADVCAISHRYKIVDGKRTIYKADKYAYAFFEHKEGKTTIKVYQPFSKYKWINKHDSSVISLWTKMPKKGAKLLLCSSLKDALCVWCNTGIPCISLQGEGYSMSNTAITELKKRFDNIYILFDNDEAGITCGKSLAEATGFTYIELPKINNQKDASDIYKSLEDKKEFKTIINRLII